MSGARPAQRLATAHALEILACLFEKYRGGIIRGDGPKELVTAVNIDSTVRRAGGPARESTTIKASCRIRGVSPRAMTLRSGLRLEWRRPVQPARS